MLFFCFFEANRNYACCSILLFDNQSGRKSAMSGNGGQKNLEELKKPVHKIVMLPPLTAAGLAQSVEGRLSAEREVAGSIPGVGPILRVLQKPEK